MRTLAVRMLLGALAWLVVAPASANTTYDDPTNWTETWIEDTGGGEGFPVPMLTMFMYDDESPYDLVDLDPFNTPDVIDDPIVFNDFVSFDGAVIGVIVQVVIPNFFDPLPIKWIGVVFEGNNGEAAGADLPRVLDIIGADAPFDHPGPALPVIGELVESDCNSTQCIERWVLHPNPDFETVKVFIPTGFEFSSMHIFTQSVPAPGALALVGSGLLGLLLLGRRRA